MQRRYNVVCVLIATDNHCAAQQPFSDQRNSILLFKRCAVIAWLYLASKLIECLRQRTTVVCRERFATLLFVQSERVLLLRAEHNIACPRVAPSSRVAVVGAVVNLNMRRK
jgi:hypothetical protein